MYRNFISVRMLLLSLVWLMSACMTIETASVIELDQIPTEVPTRQIIFVTPTPEPTSIPTFEVGTPTVRPSRTAQATATPDIAQQQAACSAVLVQLYTIASDACIGEPGGFFCNGGLPANVSPAGPVASAMSQLGALVDAREVERVHSLPLLTNNSGGLMWLRLERAPEISALLIGDVQLQDVTPPDGGFPPWQSISVVTTQHESACRNVPRSAFVVQGPYGQSARVVINGVSVAINGTLVVQTVGTETHFSALEGTSQLIIQGQNREIFAGQVLHVSYQDRNFVRPIAVPGQPRPLNFSEISHLPVVLFDRPVLLPQPGYVRTEGRVNMRAAPDEDARLLFQVPDNETLSVLGQNTEQTWYHVRLGNGETGWMRSDLVRGDLDRIDVLYDSTPQPPQRFGANRNRAVIVVEQGGNLRSAPDVSFPILTTLQEGTEVDLLARSPYSPWVKVDAGGQVGWMAMITIETDTVLSFLPQDFDVPVPAGPTAAPVFTFGGGHAYPDPRGGQ